MYESKVELTEGLENKYRDRFEKQARFMGNGIYSISGLYSTDTAELFRMFIDQQEQHNVST